MKAIVVNFGDESVVASLHEDGSPVLRDGKPIEKEFTFFFLRQKAELNDSNSAKAGYVARAIAERNGLARPKFLCYAQSSHVFYLG